MMDYEHEKALVEAALEGRWDAVQHTLREELELKQLDLLINALDALLTFADVEANRKGAEDDE